MNIYDESDIPRITEALSIEYVREEASEGALSPEQIADKFVDAYPLIFNRLHHHLVGTGRFLRNRQ